MHYRQTIRDAVKAKLEAANTMAGLNVFTSRARPVLEILQRREAVLSVYTADESSTRSPDGYTTERTLTVSIEGMAGGGDDLDDTLDTLAEQVEAAIDADPRLNTLLSDDMMLTATTSEITSRGNQQVGAFRLDFECQYITTRITEAEGTLPTLVFINPVPNADAYADILGVTDPQPEPTPCPDGVCDAPAYGGDLSDESLVRP